MSWAHPPVFLMLWDHCALAQHTNLAHLCEKGWHTEANEEHSLTQRIGQKKPCTVCTALLCLRSHLAIHGRRSVCRSGSQQGWQEWRAMLSSWGSLLLSGCWSTQDAEHILPSHYSPNMPSRRCLTKPLPSLT